MKHTSNLLYQTDWCNRLEPGFDRSHILLDDIGLLRESGLSLVPKRLRRLRITD